jgi:hypothetical protein
LTLAIDPPVRPSSVKAAASKPDAAPAPGEAERHIGEAAAAAAQAIGQALVDFEAGGQLAPAAKAASSKHLAEVAMMQLEYPDGDAGFAALVPPSGSCDSALREGTKVV